MSPKTGHTIKDKSSKFRLKGTEDDSQVYRFKYDLTPDDKKCYPGHHLRIELAYVPSYTKVRLTVSSRQLGYRSMTLASPNRLT